MGLLLSMTIVVAACTGTGELEVTDARSRMSPMLTGVGAVYFDIVNATDSDDRLVAATVPAEVAGRVEIHETFEVEHGADGGEMADSGSMDDDGMSDSGSMDDAGFAMMGMREVGHLEVAAGTTVELVPGGFHLMLLDLTTDLVPGTSFPLTLTFAEAGEVTVTVEVREEV